MSTLSFYAPYNMANPIVWHGNVTGATTSRYTISDGYRTSVYSGQFSYSSDMPTGIWQGYTEYSGSTVVVNATGFNVNAYVAANLIKSNQIQGALELILKDGGTIIGSTGADTLLGYGGYTYFAGGAGNDNLVGGSGVNFACYSGKLSDYTVTSLGAGTYTISDHVNNRDGTDTVTNIQYVVFSDTYKAIADLITPTIPVVIAPANISLSPNQLTTMQNIFTLQGSKSATNSDFWLFYDGGSGQGASDGHIHINNGYVLQNNIWSKYSGDLPVGAYALVMASDFAQTTYSSPKIVGVHDDLYAGYFTGGQWSNFAHASVIT